MRREEIEREENERQHTHIKPGKTFRANCVIGAEIELRQHIQPIELLSKGIVGAGKLCFAECKRIISANEQSSANEQNYNRENAYSCKAFEKMLFFSQGVSILGGASKIIVEEICSNENAHHIADIKV